MMTKARKGFALSIVLWIVAVLLLGIAYISALSKEHLKISYALNDKLTTQIMAKSYLEALKYYILTANFDGDKFINSVTKPLLPQKITLDGRVYLLGDVYISLRDISGMIQPYSLATVVTKSDERELYFTIRDSLLDWIDVDNIPKLNGAESAYYQLQQSLDYQPANILSLQNVDELRLIKGIKDLKTKRWHHLKKNITYKSSRINFMLINTNYLKSILKITLLEAENLINLREINREKFISIVEKNKNFNGYMMGFWISKVVKITIVSIKNLAKTKLQTTLHFEKTGKKSYTISAFKIY